MTDEQLAICLGFLLALIILGWARQIILYGLGRK